jgi:hypothetical protein
MPKIRDARAAVPFRCHSHTCSPQTQGLADLSPVSTRLVHPMTLQTAPAFSSGVSNAICFSCYADHRLEPYITQEQFHVGSHLPTMLDLLTK